MSANTKPQTYNGDFAHLPPGLEPLTKERRWVIWRWVENKSKWTKPPFQPRYPSRHASSTDENTWGTFEEARAAVVAGNADGIGYVILGSNIGAADLDHCRDPATGEIEPWADQIQNEANGAYREVTVSGTGLRVIGAVSGTKAKTHKKFNFGRNGAALELYRNAERYITISGSEVPQVGTCGALPPVDDFIDAMLARYTGPGGRKPGGLGLNSAKPQDHENNNIDYVLLIRTGAAEPHRSELFNKVVWYLANKGWSAQKILEEFEQYPNGIALKYVGRLQAEVDRCYVKWEERTRTSATGEPPPTTGIGAWPQIVVKDGDLPRMVNEAEDALLDLLAQTEDRYEIYQRGEMIVRPVWAKLKATNERDTGAWHLHQVGRVHMIETMMRAARFLRWDKRARNNVPIDCPGRVADAYLERVGKWKLPVLFGIISTPFLRHDGSICEKPGYDLASGLLFKPGWTNFQPVPHNPTKADALAALKILKDLIVSFPFVTDADRSVALSGILTPFVRRVLPAAPLHGFRAPTAGTGKSLLVDIAAMISTGQLMAVTAQGNSEEEMEKRLGADLLGGAEFISLDNCEHVLQGVFLCQVLTQQQVKIRILGQSKRVQMPTNATLFATGNNLTIASDLTRRTILCSIDAHCERPELRVFNGNILEEVCANRGTLVTAALTILRAWHLAQPTTKISAMPLGSFEDWSRRVRNALIWLGEADPCDTMELIRQSDPAKLGLEAVMTEWEHWLGTGTDYTSREIVNQAMNIPDFHAALINVAGVRGIVVTASGLSRWLQKVKDQIRNNRTIVLQSTHGGVQRWRLKKV
jgi:hypothetical protein